MADKREKYAWHPDQDRTTAAERIPIGDPLDAVRRRHEFAEGVYFGVGESNFVPYPPRPKQLTEWDRALARRVAYWERQRVIHKRVWMVLAWLALILGALLMVAVTR